MRRRVKVGRSWLRLFLFGDTDQGGVADKAEEFGQRPGTVLAQMWGGGVTLPWNLALAALIGLWLMFTRLTLGAEGGMANADHLIGAMALTVISLAAAEVARALRFLLAPLGLALWFTPFLYDVGLAQLAASVVCGLGLIVLSYRRGEIRHRYGGWQRWIF